MEAARVAAERGHDVSLFEREQELGGLARLAGRVPHRSGWAKLVTEGARRLERAGVDIHLGHEVTPDDLRSAGADAIIVATGSEFVRPLIPGANGQILDAASLLGGTDAGADHVAVAGGGAIGLGVAEWLAERGKRVSVVVARSGAIGSLDEEELTGVGAVVLAGDRRPLSGLAWFAREEALAGEVYTIGDCDRPRNALEAIAEGATVGRTV
jgi:NADPH-dependent 2,4-dienoyl-CoA reductase/sulfur reductase-like enzyme